MYAYHHRTATVLLFLLLTAILSAANALVKPNCPPRCKHKFECDPYHGGEQKWSIVDGICRVFKTQCHYDQENCLRQNHCLPAMIQSKKDKCLNFCIQKCPDKLKHVCATFAYLTSKEKSKIEHVTFNNQCELDKTACLNERAYIHVSQSPCRV